VGLLLVQQIEAVLALIQLYKKMFIKKFFNYRLVSLALRSYTFKSLCINGSTNKNLKLAPFPFYHSLSPLRPQRRVDSLNQKLSYSILSDVDRKAAAVLDQQAKASTFKEDGYQESSFLQ
jgi:hypothetical protein